MRMCSPLLFAALLAVLLTACKDSPYAGSLATNGTSQPTTKTPNVVVTPPGKVTPVLQLTDSKGTVIHLREPQAFTRNTDWIPAKYTFFEGVEVIFGDHHIAIPWDKIRHIDIIRHPEDYSFNVAVHMRDGTTKGGKISSYQLLRGETDLGKYETALSALTQVKVISGG